jgi:hypothetical protein
MAERRTSAAFNSELKHKIFSWWLGALVVKMDLVIG